MRIVVLGGGGLIGHKLFQILGERFGDVHAVLHGHRNAYSANGLFECRHVVERVDVQDFDLLRGVLTALAPDVVLNCAGITKRRPEINDPLEAIPVNALFPHRLAAWASENGVRLVHFSTDCVFDGNDGPYTESSPTTAKDSYGRTKAMGEIDYGPGLTIRSSFIGRELAMGSELLEWFLAQDGQAIKGFDEVYYSGVSTPVMARIVGDILAYHPNIEGLYQLAMPTPISKYDLLCLARDAFGVNVEIRRDTEVVSRPILDGSRLRKALNLALPSWPEMMAELASEQGLYGASAVNERGRA